jgi:hypothetical protein
VIVVCFLVISIGLTWIWRVWLRSAYEQLFIDVALELHGALGLGRASIYGFRERYINFVPFVALLLVTPGLNIRRRMTGLGIGLLVISISHLALNLSALLTPGASVPVLAALLSDTFPFLIWFIVAFPVLAKFLPNAQQTEAVKEISERDNDAKTRAE